MRTLDGLALTFLLNALWQVAAVFAAAALGDRLLRRGPARYRHALWLGATLASLLLPVWSLVPREAPAIPGPAPAAVVSSIPTEAPVWIPTAHGAARVPSSLAWMAVLVFGLSIVAHLLSLGRAWRRTRELARDVSPALVPERSAALVEHCRQAFGLKTVDILTSSAIVGPVTLGALRPAILLPPGFLDASPEDQVASALGHEMAHIRRRDYAVNLLCEAALLPIAFHPATRWLRRRLAETREMACDEAAVERLIAARPYARSLLALAFTLAGRSRPSYTLGALDADILEVRMKRLVDPTPRPGARKARASLATAALILGAAAVLAAGLSLEASSTAVSGNLSPFVGVWKAESPLNPGDKPLLWVEMAIRDSGGRPAIDLTFFGNRRQEDGSIQTDSVKTEVTDPRVTGNVLRFRTRGEFQYKPGHPKQTVEFDQVFEIAGSGEATLRQTWSSLEGRKDAPPPPPAPIVLRRAG
jgi:beta-lactamase regulating signal transducer with metallopeptidase domain